MPNKSINKVRLESLKHHSLNVDVEVDVRNIYIEKGSAGDEGDDCKEEKAIIDQEPTARMESSQDATSCRE